MTASEVLETPTADERPGNARDRVGDSSAGPHATAALPVALDLAADRTEAVRSWVEGVLGWQVVDGGDEDPVPAVLLLRDHRELTSPAGVPRRGVDREPSALSAADEPPSTSGGAAVETAGQAGLGRLAGAGGVADPTGSTGSAGSAASAGHLPGVPTVLLLPDGSDAVQAAATAARLGPAAVLGWPSDRDRLPSVVAGLLEVPRRREGSPARLMVGGSAGGVGTTTVALALGGLRAWSGTRTLAAVRGLGSPYRGVPIAALGGGDLWSAAEGLPGIDALRAVRLLDHGVVPEIADPAIEAVILDVGPDPDCDVLVCRPDAAGLAALRVTTAAAIVLVGDGAVPGRVVSSAAAGRSVLRVPWSARVARAGATGRLPAGLPGSWVAALRPLVAEVVGARVPLHPGRHAHRRSVSPAAGSFGHRRRPR